MEAARIMNCHRLSQRIDVLDQAAKLPYMAHHFWLLPQGAFAEATIGLNYSSHPGLVAETDWLGNLNIYSVYQPENDLPDQYQALQTLYTALGGDYWAASYKQKDYAEAMQALVQTPDNSVDSANLTGVLPPSMFSALPDLTILFLGTNPGLTGQVADVPYTITANMLILQLAGTSLQNTCAEPAADGKGVVYTGSCFSNLFLSDITSLSTAADKPGLICPTVHMARPSNLSNLTTAFFYNFVAADPLLYSYSNCSCALPLQPRYLRDNAGLFQMECLMSSNTSNLWALVATFSTLGFVVAVSLALYLIYRKRILEEWETMRINGLKCRHAPGTLMERQGKGMDLFHAGMSIVMTDVEGSTSLWEWNSRIMNSALALHDYTLRSLLPKYFGYEVTTEGDAFIVAFHDPIDAIGWALHVQLALLEAPWPPELLQHEKARVETCAEGKLLFRGLRVRVAINTGIPTEIIVHNVTKQVEYRGEMVDLTEALSHLPAGGQVVLSDTTFSLTAGRLQHIHLPAFTFQTARNSLEGPKPRQGSMEGLRSMYTKQLVVGSSPSVQSTDGLLSGGGGTPVSAGHGGSQAQSKGSSWFSFRHMGAPMPGLPLTHRQSADAAHIDVATDEPATPDAVGSCVTKRRFARSSSLTGTLEATALASFTHSACIIIDMGNFVLSECRNRAYTGEDAALPCIAGEHVRQILPEALLERAALLPPFDPASQVAPSFFDAPGAQAAAKVNPRPKGGLTLPSSFTSPLGIGSLASTQRFHTDLPDVTFAFVSESGYKEVAGTDKQVAMIALGRFKSCVRTSLLLYDGYECQENEGTFILAFGSPRGALEWALTLQLALLKVPWGEALLSMPATKEQHDASGQVLMRGLAAKVGISNGPITRLCPHAVTGRADYSGVAIGRAARLWPTCNAGHILIEQSLMTAVGLEWTGIQGTGPLPAAPASHLALRNHALLVHRAEVDTAAAELTCSTTSLSGIVGRQLTLGKRTSTMSRFSATLPRNPSSAAALLQSGDSLDSIPAGMPGSENRRRSSSMGHMQAPSRLLSRATSRFQDYAPRDTRDFDAWWSRSSESPLSSPRGNPPTTPRGKTMQMHVNAAFRRTGSNADEEDSNDTKIAVKEALTAASQDDGQAVVSPKGMPTSIPTAPVHVEAYHMGQFTFKGVADKVGLCQVFPASLSGRRRTDCDVDLHGWKAVSGKRSSSLALSAKVMLLDVLQLPLTAEPPLCINMVMRESLGSKQRVNNYVK
ncbi:hypothetical protein ABBQ38_002682 [Trebouxia sp. C0009 RCD-2024]